MRYAYSKTVNRTDRCLFGYEGDLEIPEGKRVIEIGDDLLRGTIKFAYLVDEDALAVTCHFIPSSSIGLSFDCTVKLEDFFLMTLKPVDHFAQAQHTGHHFHFGRAVKFTQGGQARGRCDFHVKSTWLDKYERMIIRSGCCFEHWKTWARETSEEEWQEMRIVGPWDRAVLRPVEEPVPLATGHTRFK